MSDETFVHIDIESSTGLITLDRPRVLNAVSLEMCCVIKDTLMAWADDPAIDRVLLTAMPGRAFCAGGDVRSLVPMLKADMREGDHYFQEEYGLDMLLAVYPKPVFAIASGLTMGGGAGILLNASHPVVTTAIDFAMPETAIGLFPDVGAARFLRFAPPPMGLMMAMTGWRIGAGDMLASGIASLCIDQQAAGRARQAVIDAPDTSTAHEAIARLSIAPAETPVIDEIDWLAARFEGKDVLTIRDGLEGDRHPFAENLRHALDTRCPLSIHLSHRLMTDPGLAPEDKVAALRQDYRIACRMIRHPDFTEGVRAVLIDKDNTPVWQPSALTEVTSAMIDAMITLADAAALACPDPEALMSR